MKKIITLFAVAALLWSCNSESKTTEDKTGPVVENPGAEAEKEKKAEANSEFPDPDATGSFGAAISAEGAMEASQVLSVLEGKDSVRTKIKGSISACCQAKGCWMTMALGDEKEMRVKFKDYAFFVPKNSAGKEAVVEGWAFREVVSVDEQRHYAEDEGLPQEEIDAITEPMEKISFMADGVIIAENSEQ